ncbi:MAG: double zinc ribbon domain-containing protein [Candidatus Helarchaeota archaeon]
MSKIIKKIKEKRRKKRETEIKEYLKLPFYDVVSPFSIKGRICPSCFKEKRYRIKVFEDNSDIFCPICGTKIILVRSRTFCTKCGRLMKPYESVCRICGTPVSEKAIKEGDM